MYSHITFYKTGYRFFRDFNKTYLLSNLGKAVDINDGNYSKVLINICDPANALSYANALDIDDNNNTYIINVNAENTSINVPEEIDKMFNKLMKVDSYGNSTEIDLDIPKYSYSSEKVHLSRAVGNNLDSIFEELNKKSRIE